MAEHHSKDLTEKILRYKEQKCKSTEAIEPQNQKPSKSTNSLTWKKNFT